MRQKIKQLCLAVVLLLSITLLAACSSQKQDEQQSVQITSGEADAQYISDTETAIMSYAGLGAEQRAAYIEHYTTQEDNPVLVSALEGYGAMAAEVGEVTEIETTVAETDSDGNTVVPSTLITETGKGEATFTYTQQDVTISFSAFVEKSVLLQKAGMNTLLGLAVVFSVLIFLTFLISLFKYIPGLVGQRPASAPKSAPAVSAPVTSAAPAPAEDELELVAVISAAIAAAEGTTTDSFVVRSIKRVNKSARR